MSRVQTYDQLLPQMQGVISRGLEGTLKLGQLIHKAVLMNVSYGRLSIDLEMSAYLVEKWEKVGVFWGKDRIPGCRSIHHYADVALSHPERKEAFMSRGREACTEFRRQDDAANRARCEEMDAAKRIEDPVNAHFQGVRNITVGLHMITRRATELRDLPILPIEDRLSLGIELALVIEELLQLGVDLEPSAKVLKSKHASRNRMRVA